MTKIASKVEIDNLKIVIDNEGRCLGIRCIHCLLHDICKSICLLNGTVTDKLHAEAKRMMVDILIDGEFHE